MMHTARRYAGADDFAAKAGPAAPKVLVSTIVPAFSMRSRPPRRP